MRAHRSVRMLVAAALLVSPLAPLRGAVARPLQAAGPNALPRLTPARHDGLTRALANGSITQAQYALGFRMDKGQGVAQDADQAADLYARVASRGYPLAMRAADAVSALPAGESAPGEVLPRLRTPLRAPLRAVRHGAGG